MFASEISWHVIQAMRMRTHRRSAENIESQINHGSANCSKGLSIYLSIYHPVPVADPATSTSLYCNRLHIKSLKIKLRAWYSLFEIHIHRTIIVYYCCSVLSELCILSVSSGHALGRRCGVHLSHIGCQDTSPNFRWPPSWATAAEKFSYF